MTVKLAVSRIYMHTFHVPKRNFCIIKIDSKLKTWSEIIAQNLQMNDYI